MIPPTVSIVLSCHERPKQLRACLATLDCQTYQNFECFIVHEPGDDALIEQAWEITESFGENFHFVNYPVRHNDWGNSVKLHTMLHMATGKIGMMSNADNLFAPIHIERLIQPILEDIADLTYVDYVTHYREWTPFVTSPHRGQIDLAGIMCRTSIINGTPMDVDKKLEWADSCYVERLAGKCRVKKVPGCTWIHC